jgi:hypothetical protein
MQLHLETCPLVPSAGKLQSVSAQSSRYCWYGRSAHRALRSAQLGALSLRQRSLRDADCSAFAGAVALARTLRRPQACNRCASGDLSGHKKHLRWRGHGWSCTAGARQFDAGIRIPDCPLCYRARDPTICYGRSSAVGRSRHCRPRRRRVLYSANRAWLPLDPICKQFSNDGNVCSYFRIGGLWLWPLAMA